MITSPGMAETNVLGSHRKLVQWLFTVTDKNDNRYYWSFADISTTEETGDLLQEASGVQNASGIVNDSGGDNQDGTTAFHYKILRCSSLVLNRPTPENGVLGPSNITFAISNKDNTLLWSDFVGGKVWLHISISDYTNSFRPRINRFVIRDCKPGYQELVFNCEDFVQQYLRGTYPVDSRLIKDIFPSTDSDIDDMVCVPEPYGTAYVPLRSVSISDANTITDTTISFVASADGVYAQINDSGSGLGEFEADKFVTVTGDSDNNGTYWVFTATSSRLELHPASGITDEAAGDSVTMSQVSRFYVLGDTTNTYTMDKVRSPKESGKKSEWSDLSWKLSRNGTATYYAVSKHGLNPFLDQPKDAFGIPRLLLNNIVVDKGSIFTLSAGKWGYGNGDSLGFNTVYVRTSGSADPSGLSDNYVSVDYVFDQYTIADADAKDWRLFKPIIADNNKDGIADGNGMWKPGDQFLDMPVKFSRSDNVDITNPATVVYTFLRNIGVPALDLGDSFTDLVSTFDNYTVPLAFNGAFWKKEERIKVLSELLNQCNCILVSGEQIELQVLSKTSKKEFFKSHNLTSATYRWIESGTVNNEYHVQLAAGGPDPSLPEPSCCHILGKSRTRRIPGELTAETWAYGDNDTLGYDTIYVRLTGDDDPDTKLDDHVLLPGDILKQSGQDQGPGTFVYNGITLKDVDDAMYFSWQNADEPKDKLIKKMVVLGGGTETSVSGSNLQFPLLNDSRDAQQAAALTSLRTIGRTADISFQTKMTCILLQPGDVVSPNHNDYGGSYDALIDTVSIERTDSSSKITFQCSQYSQAFADWDDVVPSAIDIATDDSLNVWRPAESGPSTNQELARSSFQVWGSPWLYVGPTENQGQYTDIQAAINALEESRHNGIYLLNGTYLDVSVFLPDRDIEIIGESQGGVILKNKIGSNCFTLYNLSSTYKFSNWTFDSQVNSNSRNKFRIHGDVHTDFTGNVDIERIVFGLDSSTYDEHAIDINDVSGDHVRIVNCIFDDCYRTIVATDDIYTSMIIENNIFNRCFICMEVNARTRLLVKDNDLLDMVQVGSSASDQVIGMQFPGATGTVDVIGNYIDGAVRLGINSNAAAEGSTFATNTVKSSYEGTSSVRGLLISGGKQNVIANTINLVVPNVTSTVYGIYLLSLADSIISSNPITVDAADNTGDHTGIYVTSDRNIVNQNNIDMVNSDAAKDIAIVLHAAAGDNQVIGNNLRRYGISIENAGPGNIIGPNTENGVNMAPSDGQFAKAFMGIV